MSYMIYLWLLRWLHVFKINCHLLGTGNIESQNIQRFTTNLPHCEQSLSMPYPLWCLIHQNTWCFKSRIYFQTSKSIIPLFYLLFGKYFLYIHMQGFVLFCSALAFFCIFILCVLLAFLPVCLYTTCTHAGGGQDRVVFLGTGVTDACDCHVASGNRTRILWKNSQCS